MPHKCLLIPISNASLAQGRGGQVVRSWLRFPFQCSPACSELNQRPILASTMGADARFRCWGRNGSSVCRIAQWNNESIGEWKEGRSNREFQSQVCIRCRQVGPLGGGDICDVQAVVNVQLGDKAGNGQVATMDLGRCRAHLN